MSSTSVCSRSWWSLSEFRVNARSDLAGDARPACERRIGPRPDFRAIRVNWDETSTAKWSHFRVNTDRTYVRARGGVLASPDKETFRRRAGLPLQSQRPVDKPVLPAPEHPAIMPKGTRVDARNVSYSELAYLPRSVRL